VQDLSNPTSTMPDFTPTPIPPGLLRKIFLGPNGIRAGWRLLIFLAIFIGFQFAVVQRAMRHVPYFAQLAKQAQTGGVISPAFSLIFESTILVLALSAAGIMSRIEKRPFGSYGIPLQGAFGKLFWQGVFWGLAFETVEMFTMFALGGFSFGNLALAGTALLKYAILWAIAFTFVGLLEEFLFRGYAQSTLASGIGFWPTATLISAAFGAVHLTNPGEGWVGALSVFLFGMFACFTLRRTGTLWFAIGLHAAADYAETFIYSVPDSGLLATGHLLNSTLHGPRWLTGGTIGPEGSLLDFILFAVAFLIFHFAYPPKKTTTEPPALAS
jgi:membrane protease YdiL (CAAX protease family)